MIFKSYILENNIESLEKQKMFLFYGENDGLKKDFKAKIKKIYKSFETINIFQDEIIINKNLLLNEILNRSLFNEKKIFFIEQASDKILEVLENIDNKIQDEKIFLFSDILDKKSKLRNYFEKSKNSGICPCYEDNEMTIKTIISTKLKGYYGLTTQIINLIIQSAGLDRIKINNEIDKITSYFQDKKIEQSKIEQLLNIKINDDFNKLKDEALNGNKTQTNTLLNETVLNNEDNFYYLNSINQRMNKLSTINDMKKNNKNVESIIANLKPPIFWKDKPTIIQQSKIWNKQNIKIAFDKIYKTELKIKSNSSIRKDLLIKNLIVDLCCAANVA